MPAFSQTFSVSGTWPCPLNYLPGSLIVMGWGEGGNGSISNHGVASGGGGGGGEFAQDNPDVTAGNNYSFTIGTGGTNANTVFTGDTLVVTAHHGNTASGATGALGGTGSTNAIHFNGGTGGGGGGGTTAGAGGGGSAGSGGAGGNGSLGPGNGGAAGAGTQPGAVGGAGGATTGNGGSGNAPGSGGGGGGAVGGSSHIGGPGAAGQVMLFWQTFIPAPPMSQRHPVPIVPVRFVSRAHQTADVVLRPTPLPWDPPRYAQRIPAPVARKMSQKQAPTGWPVQLQPLFPPGNAERRWAKPPYPRRGVTITPWPSRNVPPAEWFRRDYKPPWPRRGNIAPTGFPIPIQTPKPGSIAVSPHLRTRRRRTTHGSVGWPGTPAVLVQPPYSTWIYKRRWTKPLLPRKGVIAPTPKPFIQPPAAYNPIYELRPQRYHWFRRGNVPPTAWPIPVQPPMTSQSLRRWYKPPWPRKGVEPPTNLPEPVPTSMRMRRPQRYQWFRRGNAQPNTGLPVPIQPIELPHSVRRYARPPLQRRKSQPFAAFFIPIQPPERMQSIRRWSKPLLPRRGRTNIATFPGAQAIDGYQQLPLQLFSYAPGSAGMELSTLSLTLFPLNKFGFSFFNRYGDVVLIVLNNTSLPVSIQPNVIRTVENQTVQIPPSIVTPGQMQVFGPFPYNDFADPALIHPETSYFMTVNVSTSNSGVFAGAFRLVSAPLIGHVGRFDGLLFRVRRLISDHRSNISSTPGEIHPGESSPGA